MVHLENCTAITEIVLIGFKPLQNFRIPMFILCLIIYLFICCENLLIIYIISSSVHLKTPMFFIIQSMSICELIYVSNVVPKLLIDILFDRPTITVIGCIVQLNVLGSAGHAYAFHYVVMSYDRYLAICYPLHYSSMVNNTIYLQLGFVLCIFAVICTVVVSMLESQLQFCGQNYIDHFYCEFSPFMDLATSDTTLPRLVSAIVGAFVVLFTIFFVFVTYIFIIHTILKIPSSSGRKKTFSTCSSHLIAFSLLIAFVLGVYGAYTMPASIVTPQLVRTFTFIYFLWTPLVNPMIYSFRNKEFRNHITLWRNMRKSRWNILR